MTGTSRFVHNAILKTIGIAATARRISLTCSKHYPFPVLAEPKLILKHFRRLRELKPFSDVDSVNNTVSVPLSFDVKRLFSPDWKPKLDPHWQRGGRTTRRSYRLDRRNLSATQHSGSRLPGLCAAWLSELADQRIGELTPIAWAARI
jgi:hypothetical protein